MENFINQVLPVLQTALIAIVVAVVGYVGQAIVKVVPNLVDLVVVKVSLAKYTKIKAVALDIFNKINEDGRLGNLTQSKIATFEYMIKAKFSTITEADINLVRDAIAGEYNKDKAVVVAELTPKIVADKAVETPIEVPIEKSDASVQADTITEGTLVLSGNIEVENVNKSAVDSPVVAVDEPVIATVVAPVIVEEVPIVEAIPVVTDPVIAPVEVAVPSIELGIIPPVAETVAKIQDLLSKIPTV